MLRAPLQSRWRFLPATANGQLAFGTYLWDDTAQAYVPGGLDVLALRDRHPEPGLLAGAGQLLLDKTDGAVESLGP